MSSIGSIGGFRPPPQKPPSFEQVDSNSDGGISLDEFEASAPKGADSSKSEALFKSIDTDGSGSISKDEQQAFHAKAKKAHSELNSFLFGLQAGQNDQASATDGSGTDDIFSKVDADSSGGVSKDEFLKAFSANGSSSSSAGSSGSDRLSQLFDAIDADGDGSISKTEQSAFQKQMQDRGPPPPPPGRVSFGASQAYGNASQLGSQGWMQNSYSQAA